MSDGKAIIGASPEGIVHHIREAVREGSGMTLWGVDYMPLDGFDRLAIIGLIDIALSISATNPDEQVQRTAIRVRNLKARLYDFHESCRQMREQLGAPPEE